LSPLSLRARADSWLTKIEKVLEMEKIAYITPEMELVELKHQVALLAGSGEEPGFDPSIPPSDD